MGADADGGFARSCSVRQCTDVPEEDAPEGIAVTRRLRLVLVDNDRGYLAALDEAIATARDLDVVGRATTVGDALDLVSRLQPDVVVADVRMPGGGGERVARVALGLAPSTRVLALSVHAEGDVVAEMLAAGASAYLRKDAAIEEILGTIRSLRR
jgi:DNA-binding NarL/FixJ family response regulator